MFDLEQAIADWRQQMLAAGISAPVPLEELEVHLREEIERQLAKNELGRSAAFKSAVEKIGRAHALKTEFTKASNPMEMRFVKLAGIACAVLAGLFSLWMLLVLLTVHEANFAQRLLGLAAIVLAIASVRQGDKILPTFHRAQAGTMAGALCCLASLGGMGLFLLVVPHFLGVRAGADLPVGWMLVSFVWIWTGIAILGGMAYGLEKAAHKSTAT